MLLWKKWGSNYNWTQHIILALNWYKINIIYWDEHSVRYKTVAERDVDAC